MFELGLVMILICQQVGLLLQKKQNSDFNLNFNCIMFLVLPQRCLITGKHVSTLKS